MPQLLHLYQAESGPNGKEVCSKPTFCNKREGICADEHCESVPVNGLTGYVAKG